MGDDDDDDDERVAGAIFSKHLDHGSDDEDDDDDERVAGDQFANIGTQNQNQNICEDEDDDDDDDDEDDDRDDDDEVACKVAIHLRGLKTDRGFAGGGVNGGVFRCLRLPEILFLCIHAY